MQVDCPEDVASYIHRVGRTARYDSSGRSVLFLTPSEEKMLEKLQAAKIPIKKLKVFFPPFFFFWVGGGSLLSASSFHFSHFYLWARLI